MTKITFNLSADGFDVVLDNLLNVWKATGSCGCLTFSNGKIDARPDRMILHTGGGPADGNVPLLTLIGAKWSSKVGDEGDAMNEGTSICADQQRWKITVRQ